MAEMTAQSESAQEVTYGENYGIAFVSVSPQTMLNVPQDVLNSGNPYPIACALSNCEII